MRGERHCGTVVSTAASSMKAVGSILGPALPGLYVLLVCAWVLCWFFSFLPQSKKMHKVNCDPSVNLSVSFYVTL